MITEDEVITLARKKGFLKNAGYKDHIVYMATGADLFEFANALHDEFIKSLGEPMAYMLRNEYNEYRLEPDDKFSYQTLQINVETKLYALPNDK